MSDNPITDTDKLVEELENQIYERMASAMRQYDEEDWRLMLEGTGEHKPLGLIIAESTPRDYPIVPQDPKRFIDGLGRVRDEDYLTVKMEALGIPKPLEIGQYQSPFFEQLVKRASAPHTEHEPVKMFVRKGRYV